MMAEGPMHPTNITENLDRCRAVFFYREDQLAPEGRRATLQAFMSALVDTPACFVAQAFEEWIARGTRQPLPADIASRAQQLREDARDRVRLDGEARDTQRSADEERFGRRNHAELSPEEMKRRREFCERLREEFPSLLSPTITRAQADYGPAPTWPAPMHDHELEILLQRRNPKPSIERFREREGVSKPGAAREDRRRLQELRERRWAASAALNEEMQSRRGYPGQRQQQQPCSPHPIERQPGVTTEESQHG